MTSKLSIAGLKLRSPRVFPAILALAFANGLIGSAMGDDPAAVFGLVLSLISVGLSAFQELWRTAND